MSESIPLQMAHRRSHFLTEDVLSDSTFNFEHHRDPTSIEDVFPSSASLDDNFPEFLSSNNAPEWKRRLFELMEQPTSSTSAFIIHFLSSFLIITSAVVTVLETIPSFHLISPKFWFGVETGLVTLFTIEYLARCIAWSVTWQGLLTWIISFYGVIDLLSIFPYYVEIVLQQDTSVLFRFSILRMFRLLRVFRPFRHNSTLLLTIEVMYLSVRRSQHALFAISFFVSMVLTVFSTLLYFAERGTWDPMLEVFLNADGDPTQFTSIPAAAWFVLVTITTVGYGEITPRSFLGRLLTLPLLVFGLLLIALPSFVLGREFSLVWEEMTRDGAFDGLPAIVEIESGPPSPDISRVRRRASTHRKPKALSTYKLAQNQLELAMQVEELKKILQSQEMLLRKLVDPNSLRIASDGNPLVP